ncbi:MAG: hypothetical protein JWR40_3640 [Massilia sp.]|jgi:DNA-binding response OmpR family regulator|nr:hypothetical protein [Massilia sp.]
MPVEFRPPSKRMLLLEPDTLLRHTVALTARSMNLVDVVEAGTAGIAARMLDEKTFHGAILAVDLDPANGKAYDLELLDRVRAGATNSDPALPVAVMAHQCNVDLLASLQARKVNKVIIKPFRVRVLLDAIAELDRLANDLPERGARR